jgi:hypothetical protein
VSSGQSSALASRDHQRLDEALELRAAARRPVPGFQTVILEDP